MTDEDLLRRIRRTEYRDAIAETFSNYNYALDRGLEEMFRSLWLPDGVWEFQPPLGRYAGVDRIIEAWRQIRAQTENVHHLTTDITVLELTDDQARVRSNGIAQAAGSGEGHGLMMFVHFEDLLRQVDGQWRFASRFVHFYGDSLVEVNEVGQ